MNAERELDRFIDQFTPQVATVARAALTKMRARLPGALELAYDKLVAKNRRPRRPA